MRPGPGPGPGGQVPMAAWRSQGPVLVSGLRNYQPPPVPAQPAQPAEAMRTSFPAHQPMQGGGTPCLPGGPPQMVVRLSSYSTPRSLPRPPDEPMCAGAAPWSSPEMGMATWPAPASSIRSPRNTVSTPRDESPAPPADPAERAALRAKLRILPSPKGRPAEPNRSVSPWSRKGGRPTVQRLQSPRSALRRSASSATGSYGGSASVPASQEPSGPSSQSVTAPASVLERELGNLQRKNAEREDLRTENARLQQQLSKARNAVTLLKKQLDDATAARDRERLRAESLQNVARELQRRLEEECAKANVLQKTISNAISQNAASNGFQAPDLTGKSGQRRNRDGVAEKGAAHLDEILEKKDEKIDKDDTNEMRPRRRAKLGLEPLPEEGEAEDGEDPVPRSWEYVVQGQYDRLAEQPDFAPKLVSCFPEDAVASARSRGVAFVCTRGRRADAGVPNQDDFVLARHSLAHDGHIALYGVFDGHGQAGHHCAAYARGVLPESLFGQGSLIAGPEEALRVAFAQVQEGLLQQDFDTETSGTTATVALVLHFPVSEEDPELQGESWLYVANVGDSRAVLVSRTGEDRSEISVNRLTRDHRPDDLAEAERIQSEGGEVRRLRPGSGTSRIFAPGCQWPAMALSRSLGASIAGTCGVSSEPEVASVRIANGADELLVLGTDGLFEFCSTKEVATRLCTEGVSDEVLEDVCSVARRRWARSSYNDTVDDITAIAVSLDKSLGSRPQESEGEPDEKDQT